MPPYAMEAAARLGPQQAVDTKAHNALGRAETAKGVRRRTFCKKRPAAAATAELVPITPKAKACPRCTCHDNHSTFQRLVSFWLRAPVKPTCRIHGIERHTMSDASQRGFRPVRRLSGVGRSKHLLPPRFLLKLRLRPPRSTLLRQSPIGSPRLMTLRRL